jgi:hypothetical protein
MKSLPSFIYHGFESGQALTEFIVVAIAMVPLFLIVPLIGKYQDISYKTEMAGRYVTFEATTWNDSNGGAFKPEGQLADEVRRRFFSNPDAAIKTNDVAGNFAANRNTLWVDTANHPMISNFNNDVKVTFGTAGATTHSGGFSTVSTGANPFQGTAETVRNALGVQDRGIYTGQVTVTLAATHWPKIELANNAANDPLDNFQLTLTRHTSLAIDPWSAKDALDVEAKINKPAIFPTGQLAGVSGTVDPIVGLIDPGMSGPKLGKLDLWRDIVPKDRLKQ